MNYKRIKFPTITGRAWFQIMKITADICTLHSIYLVSYANQPGYYMTIMTYSGNGHATILYKSFGALDETVYHPAIKYNSVNGVVTIWARLTETSKYGYIQYLGGTGQCSYPMTMEEPPTDAKAFEVL